MSEPDAERPARVKRGAYPTPRSEIERAEQFVPPSADPDDGAGEPATPDDDDAAATSSSGAGSTTEPEQ